MRIISWNVFSANRKIKKGIRYILSLHPDVLCLQEVPYSVIPWLDTISGYALQSCIDWKHKHKDTKHTYVCTLTKKKPVNVRQHIYDNGFYRSLLTKLYTWLLHIEEQHNVLVVTLLVDGKPIQIANTRLSCAIGTRDRLEGFTALIQKTKHSTVPTIYCGDFNVVDSKIFNRLTGWMRGFTHFDYLLNERGSFEDLYQKEQLVNVFRGRSTSVFTRPLLQFDHILIPYSFPINSHTIAKKRFGSDHRILTVDIESKKKPHKTHKPAVSIVIPAYNEEKRIAHCLKAVQEQDFQYPYQIIVVDNNSLDQTARIARKFSVTVIKEPKKGYAYALTAGVARAQADIVLITDADCMPPKTWVSQYYTYFLSNPQSVAASGPYQYVNESLWMHTISSWLNKTIPRLLVSTLVGMNMGFRKKSYEAVGGFETRFQLQTDSYLGLKLQQIGIVGFIPMKPVIASARRFRQFMPTLWEGFLRVVNFYALKFFKQPIKQNFKDIR
jgi:endonuclease/exonuclease/phosphatase family metal-dependent hydrolase